MDLEVVGSSPITHPVNTISILPTIVIEGYRQAVRHKTLTLAVGGSNPPSPVYETLAQSVEHLTFNQVVGGSIPPCLI